MLNIRDSDREPKKKNTYTVDSLKPSVKQKTKNALLPYNWAEHVHVYVYVHVIEKKEIKDCP